MAGWVPSGTLKAALDVGKEAYGPLTKSTSLMETVNGTHVFEMKGYSHGKGPGEYIASDVFSVGGHDWIVYFYPNGKIKEGYTNNSVYVSVCIALASNTSDVWAVLKLTLLDQSGKGKHRVQCHSLMEKGPYLLKNRGSSWDCNWLIEKRELVNSNFIKDDCLVLLCTVVVVKYRKDKPMLPKIQVPPSELIGNLRCMFESEMPSDIAFVVGFETFKAHKAVLACRSPVFKAQFFGPMGDPNVKEIVVEDIAPSIFKGMLHYIYTDTLPDVSDIIEDTSLCTATVMIQHLLAAADRYDLNRLKIMCGAKLAEHIDHTTWATTIALAEQHHCIPLKDTCLAFVANRENLNVVMQSEGFKKLENYPSLLTDILKQRLK